MAAEQNVPAAAQARIARLEAGKASLRAAVASPAPSPAPTRWRTITSITLLVIAVLLVPLAVVGSWTRSHLVDTDRFVSTFAPLAEDPDVQAFVADQAMTAIDFSLDIDTLVRDAANGLIHLGLPPRAEAAIELLTVPAAEGIRALIENTVDRLVASETFAGVFTVALRESHSRAVAIIQAQDGTLISLGQDGTISLELGVVIAGVREGLIERGFSFAQAIPDIDRRIALTQASSLVTVRSVYHLATAAGLWLPWVVIALLVAGVAVSVRRARAAAVAALALTAVLLLLQAALMVGHHAFVGVVSPSVMPEAAATAVFAQIADRLCSALVLLTMLTAAVAAIAWLVGPGRAAARLRSLVRDGARRPGGRSVS